MNAQMQRAVAAIEDGRKGEAQVLLARVIKEEPNTAEAWYLLSTIVDSEEQQLKFLRRAVSCDPGHGPSQERLARLTGAERLAVPETTLGDGPAPEPAAAVEEAVAGETAMGEPAEEAVSETPLAETAAAEPSPPEAAPAAGEEFAPTAASGESEEAAETLLDFSLSETVTTAEEPAEPTAPESEPARRGRVSADSYDYLAQSEADTIPPWMVDDMPTLASPLETPAVAQVAPAEPPEVPNWLQDQPAEEWLGTGDEKPGQVLWRARQNAPSGDPSAAGPRSTRAAPASPAATIVLWVLLTLAGVVALALIYAISQYI